MHRSVPVVAILVLATALVLTTPNPVNASAPLTVDGKLALETLHLACTPSEQRTGLSQFDALPPRTGMLFPFSRERSTSFWMKNMDFSIDMIWIAANHTITGIESNVPLCGTDCSFTGTGQYVLELPAGTAATHNLTMGDTVTIRKTC